LIDDTAGQQRIIALAANKRQTPHTIAFVLTIKDTNAAAH
jgi:hypothetical protein